jgi:CHAT domain-containing protein/predicted negative regulator of RcsB-dependent stress response
LLAWSAIALCSSACRSPESDYRSLKQEVDRGEFVSALAGADAALRQYESRDALWYWRFLLLKARILVSRSQGEEALSLLRPEPPAELNSTEIPEQRKLYQGIAHRITQQFTEAERDFEEAEWLAQPLTPLYPCQLLIARAALWVDEKKYDSAEADYHKALSLARSHSLPSMEAASLADLARLTTTQGHFDEALDLYFPALQLSQSLDNKGNTATILGNLGWSYFELGDFDNALKYYKQGAEASAKSGLPVYSAYWFSGLANSYLAIHEYALAEHLAQNTLENARQLKNAQTITACLNTLANVMLRTHRLSEAKRYDQEAMKIEDSGSDTFGVPDSLLLAGHIATAERSFSDADQFFYRVLSGPKPDAPLRWQAQAGLASVRDGEGRTREAERLFLQAIDIIEKARHSINHDELRLSFLSTGIAVYGEYIDFLVRHGRPADALNQAELSRARMLIEGLSSTVKASSRMTPSVPAQKFAQQLHATLLFYWLDEGHSSLWAITPTRTAYFALPPASEINQLVKSYQQAIVNSRDPLATEERLTGEKLFATLIAPAQKLIPANSRIILLPDGSLYGLNFETLIAPEPKPHYWIEDVTLTTASSLTLLAAAANRPSATERNLLVVGNTKEANTAFPPLTQSALEMKKIEQYFPDPHRVVLEGAQATPSAYLSSNPENFSYVHFSTHGTASRTRPLESAVILSPEGDSYKLYARDVVTRHLRAELVTISACYGSGTRAYSGEGLVGLSWAFLHAGAHNVIGALWEVADAPATPELMDSLYHELNKGKDPATALREAKLKLLHSPDPGSVFKKPFYWAPFQLYAGL